MTFWDWCHRHPILTIVGFICTLIFVYSIWQDLCKVAGGRN